MGKIVKTWVYCIFLLFLCLNWVDPVAAGVLSNQKLTVSIGNEQSWTGRNGTGNLSYYGCDRSCRCTYLTGGKITCNNGTCVTKWQNKNLSYVLSSPITNNINTKEASSLTVLSNKRTVAKERLYPKAFDN